MCGTDRAYSRAHAPPYVHLCCSCTIAVPKYKCCHLRLTCTRPPGLDETARSPEHRPGTRMVCSALTRSTCSPEKTCMAPSVGLPCTCAWQLAFSAAACSLHNAEAAKGHQQGIIAGGQHGALDATSASLGRGNLHGPHHKCTTGQLTAQ